MTAVTWSQQRWLEDYSIIYYSHAKESGFREKHRTGLQRGFDPETFCAATRRDNHYTAIGPGSQWAELDFTVDLVNAVYECVHVVAWLQVKNIADRLMVPAQLEQNCNKTEMKRFSRHTLEIKTLNTKR